MNLILSYVKLIGNIEISFEDLDSAFETNQKFLNVFLNIKENSKKPLFFLLRNKIKLNKNSGMHLDESIELMKKLLEIEKDGFYFINYLKLLIQVFEICIFYQSEQKIDLIFLFKLLMSPNEPHKVLEICSPFFEKLADNKGFLNTMFEFANANYLTNKPCLLLLMILSKNLTKNTFDLNYGIFNEIFEFHEFSISFDFLNQSRQELGYALSKAFPIDDLEQIFNRIGSFFKSMIELIKQKNQIMREKEHNFAFIIIIFFQNMVRNI